MFNDNTINTIKSLKGNPYAAKILQQMLWMQVFKIVVTTIKILFGALGIFLILNGTLAGVIVLSYLQIVAILLILRIAFGVTK
jgi:hypothetical protein